MNVRCRFVAIHQTCGVSMYSIFTSGTTMLDYLERKEQDVKQPCSKMVFGID